MEHLHPCMVEIFHHYPTILQPNQPKTGFPNRTSPNNQKQLKKCSIGILQPNQRIICIWLTLTCFWLRFSQLLINENQLWLKQLCPNRTEHDPIVQD